MKTKIKDEDVHYVTEIRTGSTFTNERGRADYRRIRRTKLPKPHPLLKWNGQVSNEPQCYDNWKPDYHNL